MNTFLAIMLALTFKTDLLPLAHLYQNIDTLIPNAQRLVDLPVKKDLALKLTVDGSNRGDVDCYVLEHNHHGYGWVIVSKDESALNQCRLTYTPTTDLVRVWVVNHGSYPTNYDLVVDQ